MEVAVLPFPVGVVIKLGMGFRILHIALGIMVELIEFSLAAKNLGDYVRVAFLEHPVAIQNSPSGDCHRLEVLAGYFFRLTMPPPICRTPGSNFHRRVIGIGRVR